MEQRYRIIFFDAIDTTILFVLEIKKLIEYLHLSRMKGALERLNYVWSSLLTSSIVQDPNACSDSNIMEFKRILSRSSPVTPSEKATHETIRHIYITARDEFVRLLATHDMNGLILACDGTAIARELGVDKTINIRWNTNLSEYQVFRIGETPNRSTEQRTMDSRGKRATMEERKQKDRPPGTTKKDSGERKDRAKGAKDSAKESAKDDKDSKNKKVLNDKKEGKKKYEPKSKNRGIPPISSQDQIDIMKQLQSIKTYSETVVSNPNESNKSEKTANDIVTTAQPVPTTAQPVPTTDIVITAEDMMAINAVLGGNI